MNKIKGYIGMMAVTALMAAIGGCAHDGMRADAHLVPIFLTTSVLSSDNGSRMSGSDTRAALDLQSEQFENGQQFNVYLDNSATTIANLTYTSDGFGAALLPDGQQQPYFTFDGSSTTVHGYYPASRMTKDTESFTVAQNQVADADYKMSDLMYAEISLAKSGVMVAGELRFTHRMAKIVVNVSPSADVKKINAVSIVGGYRTIVFNDPVSCSFGANPSYRDPLSTNSGLTLYTGIAEGNVSSAALIPPQTINGTFLQVVTDLGTVNYNLSNKTFESGKTYTINLIVSAVTLNVGTYTLADWESGWNNQFFNHGAEHVVNENVEPIDLALPGGIEWANMNLGAAKETDYGILFAWGETQGYTADAREYRWQYYKWYASKDNRTCVTKYCLDKWSLYWAGEGDPDNLTTLLPEDDAATQILGDGWRMPTNQEMTDLFNTSKDTENYTWTWYPANPGYKNSGHAGYEIRNKSTGSTLFLPASGYKGSHGWRYEDYYGFYWTSELYTDTPNPYYAPILIFSGVNPDTNRMYHDGNRFIGVTTRPVRDLGN